MNTIKSVLATATMISVVFGAPIALAQDYAPPPQDDPLYMDWKNGRR